MASLQKQLDEATKYIKEKHTQIKKLVTENETTSTKQSAKIEELEKAN